jgi:hypothetical protein
MQPQLNGGTLGTVGRNLSHGTGVSAGPSAAPFKARPNALPVSMSPGIEVAGIGGRPEAWQGQACVRISKRAHREDRLSRELEPRSRRGAIVRADGPFLCAGAARCRRLRAPIV